MICYFCSFILIANTLMLQIFHNIFGITAALSSRFSYQCKAVWWWRKSQETKASTFLKKKFWFFIFKWRNSRWPPIRSLWPFYFELQKVDYRRSLFSFCGFIFWLWPRKENTAEIKSCFCLYWPVHFVRLLLFD